MAKILRTAAVIVGSIALIATGIGALAGTAIGASLLGGSFAATVVGAAASGIASIATIAAAGLSIGAALLAKPPPLGGSSTKFKADPGAPLPYLMGRTATGGNIVYRRTHNTVGYSIPDLQTFAVILSACGPVQSIDTFYADKVATSFSSGSAVGNYNTWMWQRQQLGATPESAAMSTAGLPGRTGKVTSAAPGWGASAKLSGYAAALWTLRYDKDGNQYTNGIPAPLWVGQWVKVYDPRLDSTYPGGSGSCRALNEATYVWSENPYLHGLTWCLGRYQNGKRVMGIGVPVSGIDVAAFVEGANIADTNGWKIGGAVSSRDNKWGALKSILQAGGGEPMHVGAMISCLVSTPRVTIATVTANDQAGTARVAGTTTRRGRINSIIPRYRSEAHDWEFVSADPVKVAAHVTTDGGLRESEITYSLVQGVNQAAQLARYDIENAREFGPVTLPLKPRWMGYKPGDCVAVVLPEIGLNGQSVVIRNRSIDPGTGMATLTAKSETGGKHAFALGQTGTPPPTPTLTTPPVAPQPGSGDWTIAATNLTAGASVTPALVITGSAVDAPVDAVVFEYRLWVSGQAADAGWIIAGTDLPTVVRKEITAILPGTAYEVAVRYTLRGFPGDRRVLGPVTTSGVGVPWGGVGGTGRPDDGATAGDNLQINSLLEVDLAGYNPAGFSMTRVAGISGPPTKWVVQTIAATSSGSFIWPRSAVQGGRRVFLSVSVLRTAALSTLKFSANEYDAATGSGIGPVGGAIQIVPTASGVWQTFQISGNLSSNAGSMGIAVEDMTGNTGTVQIAAVKIAYAQPGADVTASQAIVSKLSPTTGNALDNFVASDGIPFSRIVASGDARDGDAVSFPVTYSSVPQVSFSYGGNAATAGQNIKMQADSLTASGFTMRAKSQAVTVGSTITDTGSTTGSGPEPARVMNRSNSGTPFDGRFVFNYPVTVGNIAPGEPGTITVGIYCKIGGSWVQVGTADHGASGTYSVAVTPGAVDFGAGNEFGIGATYTEGSGTAVTGFTSVVYILGTVTETSLTPAGASPIKWEARL